MLILEADCRSSGTMPAKYCHMPPGYWVVITGITEGTP
nr:MAG TPA: hypothetical protein [Caudoviricetes sp.]DAQ65789.1 MAG TPA: hypothetical protein [Caudoviricetes sp.]